MIHASLFSGIGGPEVAAAMLGWENAFHCEINPFGRAVLEYWFPESKSYEDITKTDFREWRGKIDVLTGGFPCQPFSYAGKRGGREDERYLWPEMLRVIDEIRPTWVVGENVAGITTMVEGGVLTPMGCDTTLFGEGDGLHRYELRQSFTIERICRDLEGLGYSVQPVLIPAAAVGAPHRRDRVFILAYDADANRGNDAGGTGTDAGAGAGARVQERDEVREPGEPDQLRPALQGTNSDTDLTGREKPQQPGREEDREETGAGLHDRTERPRRDGNTTDADVQRRDKRQPSNLASEAERQPREASIDWADGGLRPKRRWADFPTVSPVHRGNDGLPFPLDDLTIPATRWRTESLKAYGNAIVPQVMYRIFQAIEEADGLQA